MSKRLPGYKGNKVSMTPLRDFRRPARLALPARGLALLAFFDADLRPGRPAVGGDRQRQQPEPDSFKRSADNRPPYPSAQGFTTGDDSAGYTLQSVTLPLARANA